MATLISNSTAETEAFGERVARLVERGWVLALDGDLGAGKTAFTRGFVRGIGSPARAHSPTFALLNQYRGGRLDVFHLDLYRLNSAEDLRSAGLDEYLTTPEGVSVIEWFSRCESDFDHSGVHRLRFRWIDDATREITHDLPGL